MNAVELSKPAVNASVVTPSDTTDLARPARGLYIGGAGDIRLDTVGGQTNVLFAGTVTGSIVPVQATRIRATGTTATNIVALS